MKKETYEKLDLDVYTETLDNGLRIFLTKVPRNEIHARITSLYGGSILEFKLKGEKEFTKVPAGIAHFLEHKMFEKKDYDPLQIYENNGAFANAFTTENITSYYFTGVDKFYDNLNNLLRCVSEPYFTDENVEKEKGIISQEKKEDLDNVYYIVKDKAYENTFHNLDVKYTVLGSLDDINSIKKEDLYKVYNTFYQPSNMVLTISGDIDINKTMEFIRDFYNKKDLKEKIEIIIKKQNEPDEVVKEKEIIYKNNKTKEIFINYKIRKNDVIKDKYTSRVYLNMYLAMNFSGLSELSDITTKDKNFLSGISGHMFEIDDFYILSFNATVKDDAQSAIELIDKTLKSKDFEESRFNLIKKVNLSSIILSTENPSEICSMLTNQIKIYGRLITDMHSKLLNLNFKDFKTFISELNLKNRSIVILESKKGD